MKRLTAAYWVGKAAVKLHYRRKLDIYAICAEHEPELWGKAQRKAKIPSSVRWAVWRRDLFTCHYCHSWGQDLSLDHVIPEVHGGTTEPENLVTACASCNRKKGSMGYTEFLKSAWLEKKRKSPHSSTTPAPPPTLPLGTEKTS